MYVTTGAGIDPAGLKIFADYYHAINPFTPFLANIPPGLAQQSLVSISDDALERTEFYNDWMRHQDDLAGGVAFRTRPYKGRSLVIGVNVRRHRREVINDQAQALLNYLEPHISHAFHVSEVIAELNLHHLAADPDLKAEPQGEMVICDQNLTVVCATPYLGDVLVGLLHIDHLGRLRFADPKAQYWAESLAGRSSEKGSLFFGTHQKGAWTIRALVGEMANCASSVFPGVFRGAGWPERQLTFVISRQDVTRTPVRILNDRFRLSAAESAIAILIAEGHSTSEIADTRQASLHTVRNQIRAVLQKMDVRDRGGIIREVIAIKRDLHR
ncbi:regulatory protein, luxR family [Paracoccus laeviglucosivorans]|uniref:Regulatory protein, luxR family n=2 Tax=Paracoccus laeviglucosivorans TaxID=1197861 RepID=A0A521CLN2_9RHOB|nr:regulatory protein, luxR family [Paracoccus laeviglucosivorans]